MPPKKPTPAKSGPKPAAKGPPKKAPAAKAPAKKGAAASAAKGKPAAKEESAPPVKKWTKEDEAATKIQTLIRKFLASKALQKKKKEKEDYEELMERLEKEAFVKLVKMEQELAEKERQKEEEERRRRREMQKRRQRMLEAAFDGDNDQIDCVLREVKALDDQNGVSNDVIGRATRAKNLLSMVDCEDANGNTPLSEAASGGTADTVRLLIEHGADPNSRGQFDRTPLYRAAFAGHLEVVQVLLQSGADPRLYASDGQTPENVASQEGVKNVLAEWDVAQTETLLAKLEAERERRAEAERQKREAEHAQMESQLVDLDREYQAWQKRVAKCIEELNKRIYEHDSAAVECGVVKPEITLQAIHEAEAELEIAKIRLEEARNAVSSMRLQIRQQEAEGRVEAGEVLPGVKVTIKELDDVLLRDVGNAIAESGKWPLIIDPSAQAATFLRYRDTNYLHALNPREMEPEKVRMALLGAIRFGKPLVLDMMEVDMFDTVSARLDEITPGLMNDLLDKSIIKEEKYLKILKPSDGPDYEKNKFNDARTSRFKFFIITKNPFPPQALVDLMYLIRIHIPT